MEMVLTRQGTKVNPGPAGEKEQGADIEVLSPTSRKTMQEALDSRRQEDFARSKKAHASGDADRIHVSPLREDYRYGMTFGARPKVGEPLMAGFEEELEQPRNSGRIQSIEERVAHGLNRNNLADHDHDDRIYGRSSNSEEMPRRPMYPELGAYLPLSNRAPNISPDR
jgi:hypothetical protein